MNDTYELLNVLEDDIYERMMFLLPSCLELELTPLLYTMLRTCFNEVYTKIIDFTNNFDNFFACNYLVCYQ